jgi:hypothetical protein
MATPLRVVAAVFIASADVRVRAAAIALRTGVRFTGRELAASVLETILYVLVLELAGLWVTGLVAVALWAAVFLAAVFDVLAAEDWLVDAGAACDRAMPCSESIDIASARQAVIKVLLWQFLTIKKLLRG